MPAAPPTLRLPHRVMLACLLSVLLAVPAAPVADAAQDRAARAMKKNDRNRDGRVDRGEWRKSAGIFDRIDADGDGFLTVEELRARFAGGGAGSGEDRATALGQDSSAGTRRPEAVSGAPGGLYFIDAHSQWDHRVDRRRILSLMDRGGVYRTLLSVHLKRRWQDVVDFASEAPGRIVPAVRIKGRGYHKGSPRAYLDRLRAQLGEPAFGAMAEILVWHDSDGGRYQEIRTDFADPQVRAALDGARARGWPAVIHIEFASLDAGDRERYMRRLAALLEREPDRDFVLIHMGQLDADAVGRLLRAHSNLHFMTSHASPFYRHADAQGGRGKPFINMIEGDRFGPAWKRLLLEYPDRFVFALDNVFSKFWVPGLYLAKMRLWWRVVDDLPARAAHAFAHGNAERLWRLQARPEGGMLRPDQALAALGPVTGRSAGAGVR